MQAQLAGAAPRFGAIVQSPPRGVRRFQAPRQSGFRYSHRCCGVLPFPAAGSLALHGSERLRLEPESPRRQCRSGSLSGLQRRVARPLRTGPSAARRQPVRVERGNDGVCGWQEVKKDALARLATGMSIVIITIAANGASSKSRVRREGAFDVSAKVSRTWAFGSRAPARHRQARAEADRCRSPERSSGSARVDRPLRPVGIHREFIGAAI